MHDLSIDPVRILGDIRRQALALAGDAAADFRSLLDASLPEPLDPMALLPVATGIGAGGSARDLAPVAAAVLLADVALRLIDDCADQDDPNALYHAIGIGQAVNAAFALNAAAARALHGLSRDAPGDHSTLLDRYFHALLDVCRGQQMDMAQRATTLDEYRAVVRLKTVAAYEFAAVAGARRATGDATLLALAAECGAALGWMAQILDDVEALWFPLDNEDAPAVRRGFPIHAGLAADHPNAARLNALLARGAADRAGVCRLLDGMDIRRRLLAEALDHRDRAIAALDRAPNPEGGVVLRLWLDWLLRDAGRLLSS